MPKQNITIDNHFEFIEDLKVAGIPFLVISTSFTKTVIISSDRLHFINENHDLFDNEEIYYFAQKGKLKFYELGLIKQVKNYCENLNKKVRVNRDHINYVKVNDFNNGIYKNDIWEIDGKSMYWTLAYKYKYISKEIYLKGINLDSNGNIIEPILNKWGNPTNQISKFARLIALGNLAKVKTRFMFDGKKYHEAKRERSETTENFFFKVSLESDSIMKMLSMIAGDNYLFYWVDAIFVRGENTKDQICDYFTNELGMEFKVTKIFKLLKQKSYIIAWDETNLDENENMIPRPYIFKPTSNKLLKDVLDIDKNLIFKEHYENFLEK